MVLRVGDADDLAVEAIDDADEALVAVAGGRPAQRSPRTGTGTIPDGSVPNAAGRSG